MYSKLVGFIEDLQQIEKSLNSAKNSYDDAIKKLSTGNGNLIGKAEKLKNTIHRYCRKDNGIFTDARWERVIHLLNLYHRSLYGVPLSGYYTEIYDDTVFDFCAAAQKKPREWYGENKMTIDEMREVFAFVRQYNYPLFKDFYECNLRSLGGKL